MDTKTPKPPKGVTVCDNLNEFSQIAETYGDNPRLIAAVRRFFEYTAKMDAIDKASTNAADRAEAVKDAARTNPGAMIMNEATFLQFLEGGAGDVPVDADAVPVDGDADAAVVAAVAEAVAAVPATNQPSPPVLIDEVPETPTNFLTMLFNPLAQPQHKKLYEIAKTDPLTRGLRTFCNLQKYETQVLNLIVDGARENFKTQLDRVEEGLPLLTQGGFVTLAQIKRYLNYRVDDKELNKRYIDAFETLARERLYFYDDINGNFVTMNVLQGVHNPTRKIKAYRISPEFLEVSSAIRKSLWYYDIKKQTGKTLSEIFKFRGDIAVLWVCVQLLFEAEKRNGKPFKLSIIIERAAACGVMIKRSQNWKRDFAAAFAFVNHRLIWGGTDEAKNMSKNPKEHTNPDCFWFVKTALPLPK